MQKSVFLQTPANFSFRHTVYSHGWSELLPFRLDDENWRLSYVFTGDSGTKPTSVEIRETQGGLQIDVAAKRFDEGRLIQNVRHILRLDDPLEDFYGMTNAEARLKWVSTSNAGRLLRSPTVFEDMVKTLCTTNCSWGLTKNMVTNIVGLLGKPGVGGARAFPTPAAMASVSEKFYRDEIRAGYRSPYFAELAEKVASGATDPQSWLTSELPSDELKKEIKTPRRSLDAAFHIGQILLEELGLFSTFGSSLTSDSTSRTLFLLVL